MPYAPRFARGRLLLAALALLALPRLLLAQGAVAGYSNYDALSAELRKLDESNLLTVSSLGKTLGGREIWLATVSRGPAEGKPALLVVGNVHASHLAGSELCLHMIRQLLAEADRDEALGKLLDRFTIYFIPRPAPDAVEAFFQPPYFERVGNLRATDDDRDFEADEDPPQDLNGDGQITLLRVEDPAGKWMPHPADGRVMIEADGKKNERGRWTVHSEGIDDDGDELFNEDGPGGVDFNRNFTHRYAFFQPGAGPQQVSELESRAVAEFAFARPSIALVLTFTPEDNLFDPWKPNPAAEGQRIKTAVLGADAEHLNFVAEQYRAIHGGKDAPSAPRGEGSFAEWAYFHYGRWSLAARGWWIPKTSPPEGVKPADEKRGADDLNALWWFKQQGIDGLVDWKAIEHRDFPGKKVEVGGFKPFLRLNPPAALAAPLADKHVRFVARLAELLPEVKLHEVTVTALGGGVFRVTARAINHGYLPTMSAMGKLSGQAYPLQIKLDLPEGMTLLAGSPRMRLDPLAGRGGQAEATWLVTGAEAKSRGATVTVYSPSVGSDSKSVELK